LSDTIPLRILFTTHQKSDIEPAGQSLRNDGLCFESIVACSEEEFLRALNDFDPDLIISEYSLPDFSGLRALELTRTATPETPVIILTGAIDEEVAVLCMKNGAWDCIHIDRIARLPFAVRDALNCRASNRSRITSEKAALRREYELRVILDTTADGILAVDNQGHIISANHRFQTLWNIPSELLDSKNDALILDYVLDQLIDPNEFLQKVKDLYASKKDDLDIIYFKDGRIYERFSSPMISEQEIIGRVWSFRDVTAKKRAEEELTASESKYRFLTENIKDVIWTLDVETLRFTYMSPAIKALRGFTPEEVMNAPLSSAIDPGQYDSIIQLLNETVTTFRRSNGKEGLKAQTLEILQPCKDGSFIWTEIIAQLGRNAINNRLEIFGVTRNIAERKVVEKALLASESLLNESQKIANLGSYILDIGSGQWSSSETLDEIFGIDRDYIRSVEGWLDIIDPEDREMMSLYFVQEVLRNGIPFDKEYRILNKKDNNFRWVHGLGKLDFDEDRRPTRMHGTIQDITNRKLTEKALREGEFRLRAMFMALPDMLFRVDDKGTFLDYHAKTEELYSHDQSLVGKRAADIFPEEFTGLLEEKIALTLSTRTLQTFDYQLPMQGSGLRDYEARMVASGAREVTAIVRDTTEKNLAIAEKSQLEYQLHHLQKEESLGRMAGAIAHRFNNLLQGIIGNLELALSKQPDGEISDFLSDAINTSHKASEISRLMLTYLGQTSGRRITIDLAHSCQRYLPLLQTTIPADVILITDIPTPGPMISSNATQVQQILANLVTNAWEAIGVGAGEIRLPVGMESAATIGTLHRFPVDWQPTRDEYAFLKIQDTGVGIAPEDIDQILDPFFSTKFTGRGLGLAVVLGIVKAHNGAVVIESERGLGTSFKIYFPLSHDSESVSNTDQTPLSAPFGHRTVLLVEDENQVRELTTLMLKHLGYEVIEAADGIEAIDQFRQNAGKIDCVVCDLIMPRMNGWMTLAALRQMEADLPVVFVSGYDEIQVLQGDHPDKPNAILSKPFDLIALQNTIEKTIAGGKLI